MFLDWVPAMLLLSLRMVLLILWFGKRGWLWWWSCTSIVETRSLTSPHGGSCLLKRFPMPPFPHFCLCHRLNAWRPVIYAHNMIQFYTDYIEYSKLQDLVILHRFCSLHKMLSQAGSATTANLNWLVVYFFFARWLHKTKKVPRKYIIIIL